jgi:hypothetical protein
MGVRGLLKNLLLKYQSSDLDLVEDVYRGSTLLVDGNSFLFHLLDIQMKLLYGKEYRIKREYGGNYLELQEVVVKEIHRLSHDFGFKLFFYFDGNKSYFKGDTSEKRRLNILEKWIALHAIVLGNQNIDQTQLPLLPLAKTVLLNVLGALKIPTFHCPAEADQEIAIACERLNKSATKGLRRFYCYSKDR